MAAKVLVVDDSMMVRQQVKRALSAGGFTVVEAEDGEAALERLREHGDIGLVVCDVNMPRMGGLDFLESARKEQQWATLPVVMLTTEAEPDLVKRAKSLKASGWIVKPFKADLLLASAKKLALAPAA